MSVDVVYQGLTIARGAGTKVAGRELFIETEGPMPVATPLTVINEGNSLLGRVIRVVEGVGAGMAVVPAAEGALPAWLLQMRPPVVQTVVIEADSEYDDAPAAPVEAQAEVIMDAELPPQAAAPAAPPPPEVREMIAEPPPSTATPALAQQASAESPPPFESTVEMAIPTDDGDADAAAAADKKAGSRGKKKSSSRRR